MPAEPPIYTQLSIQHARRLALAAQGFGSRQPPATIKAAHVTRLIAQCAGAVALSAALFPVGQLLAHLA
jgi:hypothetical protein